MLVLKSLSSMLLLSVQKLPKAPVTHDFLSRSSCPKILVTLNFLSRSSCLKFLSPSASCPEVPALKFMSPLTSCPEVPTLKFLSPWTSCPEIPALKFLSQSVCSARCVQSACFNELVPTLSIYPTLFCVGVGYDEVGGVLKVGGAGLEHVWVETGEGAGWSIITCI